MTDAAQPPLFAHRHLLGIRDLSPPDIELLLDRAGRRCGDSRRPDKKTSSLRGRTQINLSTRLRRARSRRSSWREKARRRRHETCRSLVLGEEG